MKAECLSLFVHSNASYCSECPHGAGQGASCALLDCDLLSSHSCFCSSNQEIQTYAIALINALFLKAPEDKRQVCSCFLVFNLSSGLSTDHIVWARQTLDLAKNLNNCFSVAGKEAPLISNVFWTSTSMFRRCSERNLKHLKGQKLILSTAWRLVGGKSILCGRGRLSGVLGIILNKHSTSPSPKRDLSGVTGGYSR